MNLAVLWSISGFVTSTFWREAVVQINVLYLDQLKIVNFFQTLKLSPPAIAIKYKIDLRQPAGMIAGKGKFFGLYFCSRTVWRYF